ncbi:Abi family protein [Leifsonia sp. SIMBA_070]|uniref:Abi family protein n=1 Tax=Leifsonia sp. SIMBA_070 TaxID=3085810 RepID=UPI00397B8B8C
MLKPFLTLDHQVILLRSRGLHIGDPDEAAALLHRLNYYRVSGYGRQFQRAPSRGDDRFDTGSSLSRIQEMAELDAQLRALLTEALVEIEIGVRSRFAYEAGRESGPYAFYLDEASYLDITPGLRGHIAKIERELSRPRLRTVQRYRVGDDLSAVPIWVAIEHMTFGALAKTLWYLATPVPALRTADALGVQRSGFGSTVHSFAVLRNVCSHHGQLWHRSFDVMFSTLAKEKRRESPHAPASTYSGIVAAKRFLRAMGRDDDWSERVDALLASDPGFREGILLPQPR